MTSGRIEKLYCYKKGVIDSQILKDCDDVSDEKNCNTIAIDPEKYLKSKPPPSAGSKLPVILR